MRLGSSGSATGMAVTPSGSADTSNAPCCASALTPPSAGFKTSFEKLTDLLTGGCAAVAAGCPAVAAVAVVSLVAGGLLLLLSSAPKLRSRRAVTMPLPSPGMHTLLRDMLTSLLPTAEAPSACTCFVLCLVAVQSRSTNCMRKRLSGRIRDVV